MGPADDILGLSHEARAGAVHGHGLCPDLLLALNDELLAQDIVGRPAELERSYAAVMAGFEPQRLGPGRAPVVYGAVSGKAGKLR